MRAHAPLCAALLAAAAAVVAPPGAAAAAVPKTPLTDPAARCLDGTLSAYYLQPGAGANASKFVIYLEGGGECTTNSSCHAQLDSVLGSSKYFPASMASLPTFLTDDARVNPDFASWSHVYVPYCSQDLHSGRVTAPSAATFGLYFSGHLVFRAVLDALAATAGLGGATDVILTGNSAGGIGVWINADYLAQRVPGARVSAVPIAGFYFYAYPYTGVNHTSSSLADFRPPAWPVTYALWDAFADESCVAGRPGDPWACMLANYSFPWVSTPSFVVEAQTDQVVLTDHDWVPAGYVSAAPEQAYLAAWRDNMTQVREWAGGRRAGGRAGGRGDGRVERAGRNYIAGGCGCGWVGRQKNAACPAVGVLLHASRPPPRALRPLSHPPRPPPLCPPLPGSGAAAGPGRGGPRRVQPRVLHPHKLLAVRAAHWRQELPGGAGRLVLWAHAAVRLQARRRLRRHVQPHVPHVRERHARRRWGAGHPPRAHMKCPPTARHERESRAHTCAHRATGEK
jgi:O-palmitoleoyl-L-serine hydrolase